MRLPIDNPKTIEDVNKNIDFLSRQIITKDILKDIATISDTAVALNWLSSNSAGIEAVVGELRTALNKLKQNIEGQ